MICNNFKVKVILCLMISLIGNIRNLALGYELQRRSDLGLQTVKDKLQALVENKFALELEVESVKSMVM